MKKSVCLVLVVMISSLLFAQATTAKGALTAASNMTSAKDSVAYLKKTAATMTSNAEKRATLTVLAGIEEQLGSYADAQSHYAQAAGLQGSSQSAVAGKSSEQLVIDAVRCALCAGDYKTASSYLNSSVRNSKDNTILAYVKLYEQWCVLCGADSSDDTKEAVALLKTYSTLESMKSVRPSVLLTLWHLTGENSYASSLKNSYPKTMEAAVVRGEVQILPTPFWYFVPRNGSDLPDIEVDKSAAGSETERKSSGTAGGEASSGKTSSASADKIVKQQLGLFKGKENAQALADKVKAKGFDAKIESEVRPSGTTYFIVVVPENKAGTIGKELKTAGFECYPVFE